MGGGSFVGTADGSGWNARVTPRQSDPQREQQRPAGRPLTPREKLIRECELSAQQQSRDLEIVHQQAIARKRQEKLRQQAEVDRKKAKALAEANERLIDGEFLNAGMTPDEIAAAWSRMIDANRVTLEFAQYIVAETQAARAHSVVVAKDEQLARLKTKYRFVLMLIEEHIRKKGWPETLESYERAITELGMN